jgi:hypothetical protein
MVLSDKHEITTRSYFESQGFDTVIGFEEMIFSPQTVAVEK